MSNCITYKCHCKLCDKDFEDVERGKEICLICKLSPAYREYLEAKKWNEILAKEVAEQYRFDCGFNPKIKYLINNSLCRVYIN